MAIGKHYDLDTDSTLANNSDTTIASQKAIKTYVDTEVDKKADPTIIRDSNSDISVKELVINRLTNEEYDVAVKEDDQLYLTPDTTDQDIADAISEHNTSNSAHTDLLNTKVDKITSTDNAIAKYNGTTGVIQNTGIIIEDNNDLKIGRYTYNVLHCQSGSDPGPQEIVIHSKIQYADMAYMPIVRIYGYAYGLQSPIELKFGFYIYGGKMGYCGAISMGAWRPEIFIFKETIDSVDYVSFGFRGYCYFPGFDVDVQFPTQSYTIAKISTIGWTASYNNSSETHIIPTDGMTDAQLNANNAVCRRIPYKSTLENLTINGTNYNGVSAVSITTPNTASAIDDILDGSNDGTAITYAPYSSQQSKLSFDTSNTNPSRTDRLNLNGYLYATKLYSNSNEVLTSHQTIKTLKTTNTAAQSTSASEAITGSGTINLHKIAKTGTFSDLVSKPTSLSGYGITDAYTKTEVDGMISSVYKPAGSVAFASLPTLSDNVLGNVYNVTDAFTTTADFVEGSGKSYPAGTNVVVVNTGTTASPTYKFDVLAGFVDLSGYVPTSRKVNNKALSADITLTAGDVGAVSTTDGVTAVVAGSTADKINVTKNSSTTTITINNVANATLATKISTQAGTSNANRHVFFAHASDLTQVVYDDDFKYNPYTNILTVGSITGTAAKATADASGNTITTTYATKAELPKIKFRDWSTT